MTKDICKYLKINSLVDESYHILIVMTPEQYVEFHKNQYYFGYNHDNEEYTLLTLDEICNFNIMLKEDINTTTTPIDILCANYGYYNYSMMKNNKCINDAFFNIIEYLYDFNTYIISIVMNI